ncbi:MAG: class I SAM-dependent methyltransferase [Chloroflexi bacterium]|nr:MAG: class I SAM-dependent methyltransferase [Chloroflexota bacterium]
MATYEPERTRNFYLLGDSQAEMVQLIATDQLFTRAMGGLLPEQPEQTIAQLHDVLDIGCGPGGWVLEMAYANPRLQARGIDVSQGMIDYANGLARANGLDNAQFHVANAIDPLDFPDGTFDLVNARQIEGAVPTAAWPPLVKEMVRVTRPGGIIRITSVEWGGVTNSTAYQTLHKLMIKGFGRTGLNHIPDERMYGATVMLGRYLRDAGSVNIQERPSIMDFSAGSEYYQPMNQQWVIVFELVEPFLLATGVATKPEIERLRQQFSIDMLQDSFRGILYMLTAWGEKP